MARISAEAFRELRSSGPAPVSGPALHRVQIIVDAVLLAQPVALAGVFGQHGSLHLKGRADIHKEVRRNRFSAAIDSGHGIHEIKMGDGSQRGSRFRRMRHIVRRRYRETGIPHQNAGRFVIAMVIHGRCCQHHLRSRPAQQLGYPPPRLVGVENRQIPKLCATIFRSDQGRCLRRFLPADARNFLGGNGRRTAVSWSHADNNHRVPHAPQQGQGPSG